MARPRKEPRESFGSTLKKEFMDELRDMSSETGVPLSKLFDQAVELLLSKKGLTRDRMRNLGENNEHDVIVDSTNGNTVVEAKTSTYDDKNSTEELKKDKLTSQFEDMDLDDE